MYDVSGDVRRHVGGGADEREQGEGETAQVHPGAADQQPRAALHQPELSRFQELRQQHGGAPQRAPALAPPLGVTK